MTTEVGHPSDYFLANPPLQPKLEVGNYVESQGFLVPPRFASTDEAYRSWPQGFIIRSEHPLEYAGPSDMLTSEVCHPRRYAKREAAGITQDDWRSSQLTGVDAPAEADRQLIADAYGYTLPEYEAAIDFSVWGAIRGINRAMFADPANSERYFVSSVGDASQSRTAAPRALHAITADGYVEVVYDDGFDGWPESYGSAEELVAYYDAVKGLDRFDSTHNPIIELQSGPDGKQWFLQYHRGRESGRLAFGFDHTPEGAPMSYAIGATRPEGEELDVAVAFADGSLLAGISNGVRTELLARAGLPVMITRKDMPSHFFAGVGAHSSRSLWSKAPLVLFNQVGEGVTPPALSDTQIREISPGVEVATARMRVVSNGREAFVQV